MIRTGMIMISPWCPDNADCKWLCNSFLSEWLGWAHLDQGWLAGWVGNGLSCSFDIVGAPVRLTWRSLQLCHLTAPPALLTQNVHSKGLGVKSTVMFVILIKSVNKFQCHYQREKLKAQQKLELLVNVQQLHAFVNWEGDNWMHGWAGQIWLKLPEK